MPSGSQRSAITFPVSSFELDSRASGPMGKRSSTRPPLSTTRFVDITPGAGEGSEGGDALVETEVKFSTNITSRQHDGLNFRWHCTLRCDLGQGEIELTANSESFCYVARQLQGPGNGRKPSGRKPKKQEVSETESDSDDDFEEVEYVPRTLRRSDRERTMPAYRKAEMLETDINSERRTLAGRTELNRGAGARMEDVAESTASQQGQSGGMWATPQPDCTQHSSGGKWKPQQQPRRQPHPEPQQNDDDPLLLTCMASQFDTPLSLFRDDSISKIARDNPVPRLLPQLQLQRTVSCDRDEEEILRQPTHFGRNLCRTESIDNLFSKSFEPEPQFPGISQCGGRQLTDGTCEREQNELVLGGRMLDEIEGKANDLLQLAASNSDLQLATSNSDVQLVQSNSDVQLARSNSSKLAGESLALSRQGSSWGDFFDELVQGDLPAAFTVAAAAE